MAINAIYSLEVYFQDRERGVKRTLNDFDSNDLKSLWNVILNNGLWVE